MWNPPPRMHHCALHWYISFLRLPLRGAWMVSAPPACTVGHMCRDCKHGDGIGHNVTVVHPPEAPVWFLPCEAAHRLEVSLFFFKTQSRGLLEYWNLKTICQWKSAILAIICFISSLGWVVGTEVSVSLTTYNTETLPAISNQWYTITSKLYRISC